MNIRVVGAHNRESQDTKCMSLLINNTLAIDAGALTSLPLRAQLRIRSILLTHQHYDHIRDIPGLALSFYQKRANINVYSTASVKNALEEHLLNGELYPKFQELPAAEPTVRFRPVGLYEKCRIENYEILALPVPHNGTTISYQIGDFEGKRVFYTADTGPGLVGCWQHVTPQLLIIDVTFPNSYEEFAVESGHLTPNLLKKELLTFRKWTGYLPHILVVHMDAANERKIRNEIDKVAKDLDISIRIAREGMRIHI